MGVRVELSLLRIPELSEVWYSSYLSFDFINISYLLYFSELALLSVVFHLLKSEVQLEHGSFPLA